MRPLAAIVALLAMQQPQFEVASIKPSNNVGGRVGIQTLPGGRLNATSVTLRYLIQFAYRLQAFEVIGGPDWVDNDRFDIAAKGDAPDGDNQFSADQAGSPSRAQLMLRSLLADRFKLVVRNETREQSMYALVAARSDGRLGSDLHRSTADCVSDSAPGSQTAVKPAPSDAKQSPCGIRLGLGTMAMGGATMKQLASTLAGLLNRSVVDHTSLTGAFDATLHWTPGQETPGLATKAGFAPAGLVDQNGPSLFTALPEQLGLKLDSMKGPVDVLVVVSAQRPAAN